MSRAQARQQSAGRLVLAGALILVNLALAGLILDKQDLLPGRGNDQNEATGGTATSAAETSPSALESTISVVTPAEAVSTSSTPDGGTTAAADTTVAAAPVDDWPGGHGPIPEGPPVPRRMILQVDGQVVLTGSAPDWATVTRVQEYAVAGGLPAGAAAIDVSQTTWHPDASPDPRSGDVIIEQTAEFAVGQTAILPESRPALDLAASYLANRPTLYAVVIGHTDDTGDEATNAQLALDRAQATVDYFIANGVIPAQLVIVAAGEDDPTASNETAEGRSANRRIEIRFKNFLVKP
jgi:outer membrane protein OmpA-like peptidoglycan-associated protein